MTTEVRGSPEVDEKLWAEATELANRFSGEVAAFFKERGSTEFSGELVTRACAMVLAAGRAMPFEHQLNVVLRARSITTVVVPTNQGEPPVPA